MSEILRTYAIYGEAIGATKSKGPKVIAAVQEPLQALCDAIAAYALQLAAWHQAGDDTAALRRRTRRRAPDATNLVVRRLAGSRLRE